MLSSIALRATGFRSSSTLRVRAQRRTFAQQSGVPCRRTGRANPSAHDTRQQEVGTRRANCRGFSRPVHRPITPLSRGGETPPRDPPPRRGRGARRRRRASATPATAGGSGSAQTWRQGARAPNQTARPTRAWRRRLVSAAGRALLRARPTLRGCRARAGPPPPHRETRRAPGGRRFAAHPKEQGGARLARWACAWRGDGAASPPASSASSAPSCRLPGRGLGLGPGDPRPINPARSATRRDAAGYAVGLTGRGSPGRGWWWPRRGPPRCLAARFDLEPGP